MNRYTLWIWMLAASTAWGAEPMRIPFTLRANKVMVPVTIGDSRPLRIVLDTGMGSDGLLLYDAALGDSLELATAGRASMGGAGAGRPQTARIADSVSFQVGPVRFDDQRVVLLEGGAFRGFPSDGVCGFTLFGSHGVELDYERMEVVLHPPGTFEADSSWAVLPMRVADTRIPWIDVRASLDGADTLALACYVDLASSETIEFLTRDGLRYRLPAGLEPVVLGRGLSGDVTGHRGPIAWVELGPHRVENLRAAFTPAAVRSRQPGADAVIGNGLLRRYQCVFDYARGRLYLRPHGGAGGRH